MDRLVLPPSAPVSPPAAAPWTEETGALSPPVPPPAAALSDSSPAEEIVAWSLERFARQHLVLTTSFGMEGCVLIDLYGRHGVPLDVIYIDTRFFFRETHELRERMAARYPHLRFLDKGTSLTPEEQEARHGRELWKRDPDACCRIRKVEPMAEALRGADVWATALRRGQSSTRAGLRTVDWDWKFQVVKVCPLAAWSRPQVWKYIQDREVPFNPLHLSGYPSIGCTHCTVPVQGIAPDGYSRQGRWNGQEKTECGLHGYGI
jgi:phosphoadenosine phosphosulfate reductase